MVQVLIVDDELVLRESLRLVLEDEGYAVAEAADGLEGLTYLRGSDVPTVVVLDLLMPRLNGVEVLEHVEAEPDLAQRHAFMMLTAQRHNLTRDQEAKLRRMQVPIMSKPYEIDDLLATVAAVAEKLPPTP